MQKKHDQNMKKQEDDKKNIENKIEKEIKKVKEEVIPEENQEDYEIEYDGTLEDE